MPPGARYPRAHEQLGRLAREAREEGLDFDAFWQRAVRPGMRAITWMDDETTRLEGAVVWPSDYEDRQVTVAATLAAEQGWRRAYDGHEPTRQERALRRLGPVLDAIGDDEPPASARRSATRAAA